MEKNVYQNWNDYGCDGLEDSIGLNELADTIIRPGYDSSEYLLESINQFNDGLQGYKSLGSVETLESLENQNKATALKKQEKYSSIGRLFEVIAFLSKQGLVLGDSKNKRKQYGERNSILTELWKFKNYDISLIKHYLDSNDWIKPNTQQYFIQILHEQVTMKILSEVADRPYSIILYEIVDANKGEKIAFMIRYVTGKNRIKERFISFDLVANSSADLEHMILTRLKSLELSPKNLVAHSYDTSSNTSSIYRKFSKRLVKKHPKALFVHHSARSLNQSLQNASCAVQEVRNALCTVNSLFNFIEACSKRTSMGKKLENVHLTLTKLAITDWNSRSMIIKAVNQTLLVVLTCLKFIDRNDKSFLGAKARVLLMAANTFEFYFIIRMLDLILSKTVNLSNSLRDSNELDTLFEQDIFHITIKSLYDLRTDDEFVRLFGVCHAYAIEIGLSTPQLKSGPELSSIIYHDYNSIGPKVQFVEQKYHTIFFKVIDLIIEEIEFKYQDKTLQPIVLMAQIIRNASSSSVHALMQRNIYTGLVDFDKLLQEVKQWKFIRTQASFKECCWSIRMKNSDRKMTKVKKTCQPYSIYEIFQAFNDLNLAKCLPQLDSLCRVYLAMPVSNIGDKRSISTLKRVKNWLHYTLGQDVPQNLAILNIEGDLTDDVDIELAINNYQKRKTNDKKL